MTILQKALDAKNILVVGHLNADPDAVGSAIALLEFYKSKGIPVKIGAAQGVNALARNLLKKLKCKIEINPEPGKFDSVIVVDTVNESQLYPVKVLDSKDRNILIDHHMPDKHFQEKFAHKYTDEKSSSTAEMVFELLEKEGFEMTEKASLALIGGIITDTAHLQFANKQTFVTLSKLLSNTKKEYIDVLEFISVPVEPSRKVAHLKASSRMQLQKIGRWIVALSYVSSFEASSARALIKIGADVSFVCSKKRDMARVSARASNNFIKRTGVNLSKDIVPRIAKHIKGSGGGHVAAISINGKYDGKEDELLETCFSELQSVLDK